MAWTTWLRAGARQWLGCALLCWVELCGVPVTQHEPGAEWPGRHGSASVRAAVAVPPQQSFDSSHLERRLMPAILHGASELHPLLSGLAAA